MLPASLKTLRKFFETWTGQTDKNFQGRTKIFNAIAEKFYPGITLLSASVAPPSVFQYYHVNYLHQFAQNYRLTNS